MPHRTPYGLTTAFLAVLGITANACGQHAETPPPPTTPAAAIPLLESTGLHLYVQEAYEGFSPEITEAVAGRYAELVDAGMDCSRHLFDWSDLQPTEHTFDPDLVREAMDARNDAGTLRQFVNITVIDSGGPEAIPEFIRDRLDAGAAWDDPEIVGPFKELLDRLVPVMLDRGMYMISFANEPGGYYEDDPQRAESFTGFVRQAIDHTRTISADLATTIVFAGTGDASIPHLMPLIDVATFNQYAYAIEAEPSCTIAGVVLPFYKAVGPDAIGPMLDDMIAAAAGRLVCIQEFGQATGWDEEPETLGPRAGLGTQRDVMIALAEGLAERREHFRTVCLWTLNDHTRDGMQYLSDAIVAEGLPACYAANITEIFGPAGLVRSDADASTKPAFHAVRASILPLKEGRDGPFDLTGDDAVDFFDVIAFLHRFQAQDPSADRVTPLGVLDAADITTFVHALRE